jgi:hypothetical protein
MFWIKKALWSLRGFSLSRQIESDIDDEFSFHIKMRTADNINAGMSPGEALADARRRFGDFERIKGRCREIRVAEKKNVGMRTLKFCIWLILCLGVVIRMISTVEQIQQIGRLTIWIPLLWLLLLYVRGMRGCKVTAVAGSRRTFAGEIN